MDAARRLSYSFMHSLVRILSVCAVLSGLQAHGGDSETPPLGPPWKRDFHDAREDALQRGKPIFLYFTKTY